MISNFHTHTELCKHAQAMPADYVLQAKKDGCSVLGFSDHTPYPDSTWVDSRMKPNQAALYMKSVRDAATLVDFPVYAGFECEWLPEFESWYRDFLLGELAADYLVFGPHWVWDDQHSDLVYVPQITSNRLLRDYTDLTIEGIRSGLYAFVAHPDLLMAGDFGWNNEVKSCFTAIIDAAVDCRVPLEVNGLGLYRKYQFNKGPQNYYPMDAFWELVSERGARVICNSDAHNPENVIKHAKNARDYAAHFNLPVIENPLVAETAAK